MSLTGGPLSTGNCRQRIAIWLDCCDREAMSFLATTSGVSGEDVRDLMLAAVEHRFGPVNRLPVTIEWLFDNASCYLARETRSFARDISLEPRTTPIESPQSNGMAEAFVRTIKRDHVRVSPCPDADTVMHSAVRLDHSLQRGSPAQGTRISFTP
jgi:putative transposase